MRGVTDLYYWLVLLLLGAISKVLSKLDFFENFADTYSIIVIGIVSVFVFIEIYKNLKEKIHRIIVIIGYYLMIGLLFIDRYIKPLDVSDSNSYHQVALNKSQGIFTSNYGGFYTDFVSLVYRLFGNQRIIAQYINVLLALTLIFFSFKVLTYIKIDNKYKTIGLAMISFSPNFLMMACVLRRETIVSFLLSISILFFIKWWDTNITYNFIIATSVCFVAGIFHSGAIAPIIGYFAVLLLYDRKAKAFNFRFKSIIGILIVVFVFFYLNNQYGDILFGKFQTDKSITELAERVENGRGGSGYSIKGFSTGNETVDIILNTPLRALYFVLSPMPWDWRGVSDIIAFICSSMFYAVGYVWAYITLKYRTKKQNYHNLVIVLLIMMISACLMFAWGVSNAGTAMRHRDKFISIYVVMCVYSLHCRRLDLYENNIET